MRIEKYKKIGPSKYKIYFEKENEYILYEDVILKYNLLIDKEVNLTTLESILKDNLYYESYNSCLSYIGRKMRTKKEIKHYLEKREIEDNIINKVIEELINNGYLNDKIYIKSYIHDKVYLSNNGPIKIKNDLLKLGFNETDINNELNDIDNEEWLDKLTKYIKKKKKNNTKYSNYIFSRRLTEDLTLKGYPKEMFLDLITSEEDNEDIKKKEYDKIYNKLSKKYKGKELEYKIKNEMYKKGFII